MAAETEFPDIVVDGDPSKPSTTVGYENRAVVARTEFADIGREGQSFPEFDLISLDYFELGAYRVHFQSKKNPECEMEDEVESNQWCFGGAAIAQLHESIRYRFLRPPDLAPEPK